MRDRTVQTDKLRNIRPGTLVRLGEDQFRIINSIQLSAPNLPPAMLHEAKTRSDTRRWFWISQTSDKDWWVECWLRQRHDGTDPTTPHALRGGHQSALETRYIPGQKLSYRYSLNDRTGEFAAIYYRRLLGNGAQIIFGRFDDQEWTRFDGYEIHMMGLFVE